MKDSHADKRMIIYVSVPYMPHRKDISPEEVLAHKKAQVKRTAQIGEAIIRRGHIPILFNTTFGYWEYKSEYFNWESFMKVAFQYLVFSNAFYFDAPSKGTMLELAYAKDKGLPIFTSIEQIPKLPLPDLNALKEGLTVINHDNVEEVLRETREFTAKLLAEKGYVLDQ